MSMLQYLLDGATTATDPTQGGFMQSWGTLIMLAVMVLVFWLFIIRPQKKQDKQINDMRNGLEVGDEITTIGGIIGEIVSIKEETVLIETSGERTKIRVLRSAIKNVDVRAADKN